MKTNRIEILQNLLKNNPNDAFTLFALAKEFEKINDVESAKTIYLNIKATHPTYVGMYYHFGKLLENQELVKDALTIYAEGIVQTKKNGDFHALSELQNAYQNLQLEQDI